MEEWCRHSDIEVIGLQFFCVTVLIHSFKGTFCQSRSGYKKSSCIVSSYSIVNYIKCCKITDYFSASLLGQTSWDGHGCIYLVVEIKDALWVQYCRQKLFCFTTSEPWGSSRNGTILQQFLIIVFLQHTWNGMKFYTTFPPNTGDSYISNRPGWRHGWHAR